MKHFVTGYRTGTSCFAITCMRVFMVRLLALYQPTTHHWSFFREVSSVLPLNQMSMQTKQRGNGQLNRWVCANLSDSMVHMESGQLLLVPPEGIVMSGSNVRRLAFGSRHDESCMGIGKDGTAEVV